MTIFPKDTVIGGVCLLPPGFSSQRVLSSRMFQTLNATVQIAGLNDVSASLAVSASEMGFLQATSGEISPTSS